MLATALLVARSKLRSRPECANAFGPTNTRKLDCRSANRAESNFENLEWSSFPTQKQRSSVLATMSRFYRIDIPRLAARCRGNAVPDCSGLLHLAAAYQAIHDILSRNGRMTLPCRHVAGSALLAWGRLLLLRSRSTAPLARRMRLRRSMAHSCRHHRPSSRRSLGPSRSPVGRKKPICHSASP
jgi:hypothetical protein